MKITFIGAAHEVTGSCTLIECCGKKILIDCGMEQGTDVFENIEIPFNEKQIDCVLLTHAHIDHSGKLPLLYKKGYRGPVYMTGASEELCKIMLMDSASIQESEAEWKNRKSKRAGKKQNKPSYNSKDAAGLLRLIKGVSYGKNIQLFDGITATFTDMGHLLGSAAIKLSLTENGETRTIVFSGDIGNINRPIVRDPQPINEADYAVVESTYGTRVHGDVPDYIGKLAEYIQRTLDRGGNLLIPSFAIGRTQEMLYFIREIKQKGLVRGHEGFPVYVDSPLAAEATEIFMNCGIEYLDKEAKELVSRGINPIDFDGLRLSMSTEESKAINRDRQPKVIIASSGMCDAGRIKHHLKHNLWRKESFVLFVGYQSEGTLGRKIFDGAKTVKLFNEQIKVACEVAVLEGISGHADKPGIIRWLEGFTAKPGIVFLNHGEHEEMEAFGRELSAMDYHIEMPYSGTSFDLITAEPVDITEGLRLKQKKNPTDEKREEKERKKALKSLSDAVKKINQLSADSTLTTEEILSLTGKLTELLQKTNIKETEE